ncbi:hypothetical protein BKA80DRAFT_275050 [Phyllosticta citrichinensis]
MVLRHRNTAPVLCAAPVIALRLRLLRPAPVAPAAGAAVVRALALRLPSVGRLRLRLLSLLLIPPSVGARRRGEALEKAVELYCLKGVVLWVAGMGFDVLELKCGNGSEGQALVGYQMAPFSREQAVGQCNPIFLPVHCTRRTTCDGDSTDSGSANCGSIVPYRFCNM